MNIEITAIKILLDNLGVDEVHVYTDKPSPVYPFSEKDENTLILRFNVARGNGIDYIINNFNIDHQCVTVQNIFTGETCTLSEYKINNGSDELKAI
jgi:hypothetical protein